MSEEDSDDGSPPRSRRGSPESWRALEEEEIAKAIALSIAEEQERKELLEELFTLTNDASVPALQERLDVVYNASLSSDTYGDKLRSILASLFNDSSLSDVVLSLAGAEDLPSHSLVLSTWSPVLSSMLKGTNPKDYDRMELNDSRDLLPKTGLKRKRAEAATESIAALPDDRQEKTTGGDDKELDTDVVQVLFYLVNSQF